MPNCFFTWDNLREGLVEALVQELQVDGSGPAEALRRKYGPRPGEDFVLDGWDVLRERWLAHDREALGAVVQRLWQPSRDGYRRPATVGDELEWLRQRRNTRRLREVVLVELIAAGARSTVPSAPVGHEVAAPPTPHETPSQPTQCEAAGVGVPSSERRAGQTPPRAREHWSTMTESTITNHAGFIWSVADLLRGDYKQSEYGKIILPLTVLRRLDCVLEPTKAAVLARAEALKGRVENVEPVLCAVAHQSFYNISQLDFRRLLGDPAQVAGNLRAYIAGFSPGAREVLDKFDFDTQITRLARADLLYLVVSRFAEVDLHPDTVSNLEMGYLYEELIRRFSELSNETAGEHFTPREVIRLMVNLLFAEDDRLLTGTGVIKTLYDPACGTGGMLSVAEDHLRSLNPSARLEVFGQELNDETYAICRSDMMLKGQDASHIVCGNSFSDDGHKAGRFDYMLANPPFGVEWKKVEDAVRREAETQGFSGRFGAGLPRINDGSFLFLQHMVSKMKPVSEGGSRLAIVFNGSPLFTGAAGSGESEIRRWLIENDWLEAIVALPDQLFYNTGISTYFWVLTNRKRPERRGKVQLIDARDYWVKMRRSLGDKRKEISADQIAEITRLYADFTEGERVKIMPNESFGFQRITVERPLRLRWEVAPETHPATSGNHTVGNAFCPGASKGLVRPGQPRGDDHDRAQRNSDQAWAAPQGHREAALGPGGRKGP